MEPTTKEFRDLFHDEEKQFKKSHLQMFGDPKQKIKKLLENE